jgi:Lon protease-like protein
MSSASVELPDRVPLFPLPNVVLFPRAVLPLHIFEERYKQMTADVLSSHGQVAMALLCPGWEREYYGRPVIEPVVCVGTILSHERLADGRYNFLLQGHTRARVADEGPRGEKPYRLARLQPLQESAATEDDLTPERHRLTSLFDRPAYVSSVPAGRQFREMLASGVPIAVIVDLLAFHVLPVEDVALKQSLLAEADVRTRVRRVADAIGALEPAWRNVPQDASWN